MEGGYTVAEQTGNSFEHSIGTGPKCRVSSLSSTIFGSCLAQHQVSRSVLTTALASGRFIRSLMMKTSFQGSLSFSQTRGEYDPPVFGSRYARSLPAKNVFGQSVMNLAKRSIETSGAHCCLKVTNVLFGLSYHRYCDNVIQM